MGCFDLAIVGGGPAGAMLARLLGNGGVYGGIALLEGRNMDAPPCPGKEKSCGGLLAPDAQKAMAALDLALPQQVLAAPLCFSVRALDLSAGLERWYSRSYININRPLWDRWLFSLAAQSAGVTAMPGCRVLEVRREGGLWHITCRSGSNNKRELTLQARILVGADGAMSLVRRKQFGGNMPYYVSVQEYFPLAACGQRPHMAAFFDNEITDYYAWGIPKDGEFILGAALHPAGAERRFNLLKERLAAFGYAHGSALRREATVINRPGPKQIMQAKSGNGLFLLGEAAGFISPSSAEGLSLALGSAHKLFLALGRHSKNAAMASKMYEKSLLPLRVRLFAKLGKSAIIYTPWLRQIIMKLGVSALTPW